MQSDRFTIKSQEALQAAQRLADERRNPQTTPEHLLRDQTSGVQERDGMEITDPWRPLALLIPPPG
jgi:ATP-dependent Clp protease ATP-binding subunit ClpB